MNMKKEFRYFSIFNHEKETEYLQEQHRQGWKFLRVTGLGIYHFEACDPENMIYQLDYNQEGSKNKEEYVKMFSDCGWEYMQEYAGYSYFRKPMNEEGVAEEIFCDEASRLAMLERVYKSRLMPLLIIISACFIPQFIINLFNRQYLLATVYGVILLIYLSLFVYCVYHYSRKKKANYSFQTK